MFPWFLFFVVLFHVVTLVVWVWRWRRDRIRAGLVNHRDQHAYCASCGYDLTGKDVDGVEQVGTTECPECGRGIKTASDVLVSKLIKNKMSHKRFALMVGMQVLLVMIMAWIFTRQYRNPGTAQIPVATVIQQAFPFNAAQQNTSAMYELDYRLRNGGVSRAEHLKLLAQALAYQRDPSKPWQHLFGEWIEAGRAKGLVSDQQWQQYTTRPGLIQLELRERIHVGDPVVVRMDLDTSKLRTSLDYQFDVYDMLRDGNATLRLYHDTDKPSPPELLTERVRLGTHWPDSFTPTLSDGAPLPPGRYKVVVEASLTWPDPATRGKAKSRTVRLSSHIEVFPDTHPLYVPVQDDVLARQIQDTLYQELLNSGGTRLKRSAGGTYLSVHLKNPPSTIAGSFDLSVDVNHFRSSTPWTFEPTPVSNSWHEITFFVPDEVIQKADDPDQPFDRFTLWLVPNPEHLKREAVGYEYLDHTLHLRDIPMGLPEP